MRKPLICMALAWMVMPAFAQSGENEKKGTHHKCYGAPDDFGYGP